MSSDVSGIGCSYTMPDLSRDVQQPIEYERSPLQGACSGINSTYIDQPKAKHACDVCGKSFTTKHWLTYHMAKVHDIGDIERFPCHYCSREFTQKSSLKLHLRHTHKISQFTCNFVLARYWLTMTEYMYAVLTLLNLLGWIVWYSMKLYKFVM